MLAECRGFESRQEYFLRSEILAKAVPSRYIRRFIFKRNGFSAWGVLCLVGICCRHCFYVRNSQKTLPTKPDDSFISRIRDFWNHAHRSCQRLSTRAVHACLHHCCHGISRNGVSDMGGVSGKAQRASGRQFNGVQLHFMRVASVR